MSALHVAGAAKAAPRPVNIPTARSLPCGRKAEPIMTPALNAYTALALAIIFEVTASAFLQQSAQFTRPWSTLAMVLFYVASFYALSVAIRVIPLSIAYAIWGGIGIILTATVSFVLFRQMLDAAAFVGIALIVSGVVVINLFSGTTVH
jgi:small multidrug resistance pump